MVYLTLVAHMRLTKNGVTHCLNKNFPPHGVIGNDLKMGCEPFKIINREWDECREKYVMHTRIDYWFLQDQIDLCCFMEPNAYMYTYKIFSRIGFHVIRHGSILVSKQGKLIRTKGPIQGLRFLFFLQ